MPLPPGVVKIGVVGVGVVIQACPERAWLKPRARRGVVGMGVVAPVNGCG